ncbi:GTPase HflX [Bhargavaea ullalensis]
MQERAVLVGVELDRDEQFEYSMEELASLAEACGVEVAGTVTQGLDRVNPSHYIGSGKVREIKAYHDETDSNVVIFNDELSPSQIRNLETELETKVIDRTMLILDIFARRAKTKEAQMQVELAQLQYMLPRLVGLRASLSRQAGSTGGGVATRGPGETKLELDRRKIEDQIARLRRELESVKVHRETQRKRRVKREVPVVSLVGYTNAGKSTIMNGMLAGLGEEAGRQVLEKDMLFATLDTSVRKIRLEDNREFLLTDTVGFVGRLPHHLVKAFRSTLEEAADADLLLQVVDVSHPEYRYMMQVTEDTLSDIGIEGIQELFVFNKSDLAGLEHPRVQDNNIWLSAKNADDIHALTGLIASKVFGDFVRCRMLVPFDRGDVVSWLNEHADVLETEYTEDGTLMEVDMREADRNRYSEFVQ